MRRRADFVAVTRRGRRAAGRTLVVHLLRPDAPSADPCLVGFVVGRSVGGSVVRHRVVRRLRAAVGCRLDRLPDGSRVVVRALPPAGQARSADLDADLDAGLDRLLTREPA